MVRARFLTTLISLLLLALWLGGGTAAAAQGGGRGLRVELGCELRSNSWVREAAERDPVASAPGHARATAPESFFYHWRELDNTGAVAGEAPTPALVVSFGASGPVAAAGPRPWAHHLLSHFGCD